MNRDWKHTDRKEQRKRLNKDCRKPRKSKQRAIIPHATQFSRHLESKRSDSFKTLNTVLGLRGSEQRDFNSVLSEC